MNTFNKLWNVVTPLQAKEKINSQISKLKIEVPQNLEEQAISLVGKDIYEKLIKGYTEKQWGKDAKELPSFIIKRIPIRFTYDNNYFNDLYQGIPIGGYKSIISKMLNNIEIELNTDYFLNKEKFNKIAYKTLFTGMIDQYYNYCFGELEYRGLKFKTEIINQKNFQGNAVVNYTEYDIPYTRIIEHKHFEYGTQDKTVITYEYPITWSHGKEPFYSINDNRNNQIYDNYKKLADKEKNVLFGGRLGLYKYFDMNNIIEIALNLAKKELN